MGGKWRSDKWFVSPFNFVPEVVKDLKFPEKIVFHDTTLRDGEQQPCVVFRKEDKIEIAKMLDEAGVHRIEAGMPAVSKEDEEAVKAIAQENLNADVYAFCRCLKSDVDLALKCDVDGVIMELPSSEHLIKYAYGWDVSTAVKRAVEATEYAKAHGLKITFFCIDATRSNLEFLLNLFNQVRKYVDAWCIADTFGVCIPQAYYYLIKQLKEKTGFTLEVHTHNDFGLAVANAIFGLLAGAEVVHVTVNGIGERCGNASLEETVMALELLFGIKTGIKLEKLWELSKLVEKLSGIQIHPHKAIVGENVFRVESGIVVDWYYKLSKISQVLITFPYHWSLVGRPEPKIVIGKKSGKSSIIMKLEELGLKATDEQIMEILSKVKEESIKKKRDLTMDEFKEIVKSVLKI